MTSLIFIMYYLLFSLSVYSWVVFLVILFQSFDTHAQCENTCSQCARRYGCMTSAWGKCCTQFFMSNGRKRSYSNDQVMEYVRLQRKVSSVSIETLTHQGRDKMDAISQTTFSNAFSWMKMYQFRLRFHWSLFPRVQLTIFQHWFR